MSGSKRSLDYLEEVSGKTVQLTSSYRPVSITGNLGQLTTVYEKNWTCKSCQQENYPTKDRCFRCKNQRPNDEKRDYLANPAFDAMKRGEEIPWQEAIDPTSFQMYYYNKVTGVTQWERPEELGPAPLATGWFGRGQVGSEAQKYIDNNNRYLTRPARQQKDFIDPSQYHVEGRNEYNIWYGTYGGEYERNKSKEKAMDRVNIELDAGYTHADNINGDKNTKNKYNKKYFCLHFARGMCTKGHTCMYFHRIPTPEDNKNIDELVDCFGRARHKDHKDDMGGTGSFMKPSRTLYVANLLKHKYTDIKELENVLMRHFSEFGEIEHCNVIPRLSIAFPRFRLRTSAEFAKEAMSNQSLDHDEILAIKWAHDDPNPMAQEAMARADKDAMTALLKAKGISIEAAPFQYPSDYLVPDAKRLKTDDSGTVDPTLAAIAYPNTDSQYDSAVTTDQYNEYYRQYQQYYEQYYTAQSETAVSSNANNTDIGSSTVKSVRDSDRVTANSNSNEDDDEDEEDEDEWKMFTDADSGKPYWYSEYTGESTWTDPNAKNK
jgi:hypothetical protein